MFKPLSLIFSCERVECSFDKHADISLPTARNFLLKIRKQKLLAFLKTFVFIEWLVWPRTMQFRQTCPKFSARIWKKPFELQKNMVNFFLKLFLWRSRMEFWQTCWFFCRQPKRFTIKIRKQGTNYYPSSKHLFSANGSSGQI